MAACGSTRRSSVSFQLRDPGSQNFFKLWVRVIRIGRRKDRSFAIEKGDRKWCYLEDCENPQETINHPQTGEVRRKEGILGKFDPRDKCVRLGTNFSALPERFPVQFIH